MKKMNQKLLAGVLAASALAASAFAPVAQADVSASVGISNMYYWRGLDLGLGSAAVSGDLKYSHDSGIYGGVWMSSGDFFNGTEYDLYFGWSGEFGDFGVDVSYWSYNYPQVPIAPGDFAEIVLGLSYGPVAFTYYDNIADGDGFGDEEYNYYTLAYSHEAWTFKYGAHEFDYAHFDTTYAYNDNLSFTLGLVVDDVDGAFNDEPQFVVNYTLPIE